jgi:hypothetical protein
MTYLVAATAALFSLWVVMLVRFILRAMFRGVSTRMSVPPDPVALRRDRTFLYALTVASAAMTSLCAWLILSI